MSPSGAAAGFVTTHWSVVVAARENASPEARQALAELCRTYWYPLYAFIRRQGQSADESQDLTQELFARLLEKDFLGAVDRDKGKFRSFLLAACKHFLANERDRARAQKRGGGRDLLSIDGQAAESRYRLEPAHSLTPEKLFERRWALTLLDQVLARLREEFVAAGKDKLFEQLKVFLTGDKPATRQGQAARELGMTEGAVKVAVHRLRGRYRELLQEEIARTLDDPGQVQDEICALFAALNP
ncbi:MAG TPA: sigma-70 family RNA polymerase sigma factor [Gemmataceae bacterium]|jgi:RNA polymerase sigma-70 factor (ECF subfamily)|nr:sigma-70 family RNA polymerase sigma factor [Gemmataceae bacterium]